MFTGILQCQLSQGSLSQSDVKATVCGLKEVRESLLLNMHISPFYTTYLTVDIVTQPIHIVYFFLTYFNFTFYHPSSVIIVKN